MPPKTALVRLATRRSPYVCHSCLSGLAKEQLKPSVVRPYASASKGKARLSADAKETVEGRRKETPEKAYTVKYFEKDAAGEVREVPVGEDGDDVDMEDIKALEASALAKIEKLDATLESLNKKTDFLERILQRDGPPGSLEAYQKALETYDVMSSDFMPIPLIADVTEGGGKMRKSELQKLNQALARLNRSIERCITLLRKNELDHRHISKLWAYFTQAKSILTDPQRLVPKSAWNDLWTILSWESDRNPKRMAYIRGLCHTMRAHGTELSDQQQLLQIESAFSEGYESVATENWKRLRPTLGSSPSCAMAFWELGVRLWAQVGDIERAERACQAVLDRASPSTPADSRVLLHLIKAYASTSDLADAEKGFRLYRRMRDLAAELDRPMEIEDYDDAISIFLTTGHTDYAMYTFTDMIYSGTVNLYGKKKLPSPVKNSFFFGKWLKRLIGARDLDGAYKVLVYMQDNGVMAASVQVNGLIGAWLRSRTEENRKKAELLAWSMIRARKAFVELRQRERSIEWPIRLYDGRPRDSEHRGDDLDYTMVPRATAETFVLLAENYRERGLFRRLEELFVAYKECEIGGDAMMMNELIMAAVSQGDAEKARELYELMVHEHGILPNTDTYAVLFKSLPVNARRGRQILRTAPELSAFSQTQARAYFRDMVSSTGLRLDRRPTRHGELSEGQVKLILHSFRKCNDWAGMIVALVCLRDVMRFKITRNVLLEMIAELEEIDRPSPRTAKVVMLTTMKLHTMIDRMQKRRLRDQAQSEDAGEVVEVEVEPEAAKGPAALKDPGVLYDILLEYYCKKAKVDYHGTKKSEMLFREAMKEMGADFVASPDFPLLEDDVYPAGQEEEAR